MITSKDVIKSMAMSKDDFNGWSGFDKRMALSGQVRTVKAGSFKTTVSKDAIDNVTLSKDSLKRWLGFDKQTLLKRSGLCHQSRWL